MTSIINALNILFPGNQWCVNGDFEDADFSIKCCTDNTIVPSNNDIKATILQLDFSSLLAIKKEEITNNCEIIRNSPFIYNLNGQSYSIDGSVNNRLFLIQAGMILDDVSTVLIVTCDEDAINLNKNDIVNINYGFIQRDSKICQEALKLKTYINTLSNIIDLQNVSTKL